MLDPSILRAMQAAGASIDVIIAAVEADAALDHAKADDKRSKDAERQRQHRARNAVSRDVTVTGCDIADSVTSDPLSLPPNENISNPPTHTPGTQTPAHVRGGDFPRLDCAKPDVWRDFLKNRRKKNLPNTETAHRKLVRDLTAMAAQTGWPPGKVFEACVEQGWGAIYETDEMKAAKNERSNQNIRPIGTGSNRQDRRSSLAIAIDEGLEWLGPQAQVS